MTGLMRMKRKTLFRSPAPVAFLKMASQLKAVKSYIGLGIIVGVLTGCATGGLKMPAEYAQPNKKIAIVSIVPPYPIDLGLGFASGFGALAC
jgi:hypothetical protein